jgi:hypothetical protein
MNWLARSAWAEIFFKTAVASAAARRELFSFFRPPPAKY